MTTCEAMARGGIHDQLGGGFARYSVDAHWTVPHFEKMLYDNAQLCRVYAHLWRTTGSALARRVALDTADFMVRELRTAQGGFASALDADSDDGHGGPHGGGLLRLDARAAARGAGRGRRCLRRRPLRRHRGGHLRARRLGAAADRRGGPGRRAACAGGAGAAVRRPREASAARPGREGGDRLERAGDRRARRDRRYFARPDLVEAAAAAADLLLAVHMDDRGRLVRTSRDGRAGGSDGVLEDYADLAEGLHALYAVTGEAGLARGGRRSAGVGAAPLHRRPGRLLRHRGRRRAADPASAGPDGQRHPVGLDGCRACPSHPRGLHRQRPSPSGGRGGAGRGAGSGAARAPVRRLGSGGGRGAARRSARGGRGGGARRPGDGRSAPGRAAGHGAGSGRRAGRAGR